MNPTHANQIGYTDITPYEIIKIVSGKTIEIRKMKCERGFQPNCVNNTEQGQKWIITSDAGFPVKRIRLQKNGLWKDAKGNTYKLAESPRKFYDYNF
jgi:hypothetical protein